MGVGIILRQQLKIYSDELLTITTDSKNTFLMSLNEIILSNARMIFRENRANSLSSKKIRR